MAEKEIAVSLRNITKTFGTVVANNDVSLDIYKEIFNINLEDQ